MGAKDDSLLNEYKFNNKSSTLNALCSLLFVLCSLFFALCSLLFVLCSLLFVLCSILLFQQLASSAFRMSYIQFPEPHS
jgi:hypothetical protein